MSLDAQATSGSKTQKNNLGTVKPKLGFNIISCAVMILGALLLGVIFLAFIVAKTGFVSVPVLGRFYHGPTPTRLIQAEPIEWDQFRAQLAAEIYGQRERKDGLYAVQLNERVLSGLVKNVADQGLRDRAWKVDLIQVAVTPEFMELYLKLGWYQVGNLDVLIKFKPKLNDKGDVHFEILETRIGDLKLPTSWGMALVSNVFSRDLGSWELKVGGENAVKSISLLERGLNIILSK